MTDEETQERKKTAAMPIGEYSPDVDTNRFVVRPMPPSGAFGPLEDSDTVRTLPSYPGDTAGGTSENMTHRRPQSTSLEDETTED
jgi:hypothetical protein